MFRKILTLGSVKNGIKVIEKKGFHKGCTSLFMHERHSNVEENRKRIGIVGGSICAGQVYIHVLASIFELLTFVFISNYCFYESF